MTGLDSVEELRAASPETCRRLFQQVVRHRLEHRVDDSILVISGPRAFGKSTIAKQLAESRKTSVTMVIGSDEPEAAALAATALRFIAENSAELARSDRRSLVIIDNLDLLLGPRGTVRAGGTTEGQAERIEDEYLFRVLSSARSKSNTLRVVLTTTRDPALLYHAQHRISRILPPQAIDLGDIPTAEWERIILDALTEFVPRVALAKRKSVAALLGSFGGGHPALIAPGMNLAIELLSAPKDDKQARSIVSDEAKFERTIESAMTHLGGRIILRQIGALLTADVHSNERAIGDALRSAVRESEGSSEIPFVIEDILVAAPIYEAGITRKHPRLPGHFFLRCDAVARLVATLLNESASQRAAITDETRTAIPIVRFTLRELSTSGRGELALDAAGETRRRAVLRSSSVAIISACSRAKGGVVPHETIKSAFKARNLTAESAKTVTTAMSRLGEDLAEILKGEQNLILNERGAGYRLNDAKYSVALITSIGARAL